MDLEFESFEDIPEPFIKYEKASTPKKEKTEQSIHKTNGKINDKLFILLVLIIFYDLF